MANPIRGEVGVKVGEETYTLVFTINAIVELEERLGKPISEIAGGMGSNVSFSLLRTLFWAGLQDRHGLSEVEAGNLMQEIGFAEASKLVTQAFARAFPEAQRGARPRQAPASGAGASS
ncbi:MAG: GTA-gp10 family protein [Brevundimonas sp.]|jgi:hypothetical protein|uniref:GTA-gp10 family protein n=1 Tax=Brevundimonas sp. TaxID=1871086 RepID=UPI00391F5A03